jgi:signal transduction histidine kinase/integral membrane sensor domain MASE1
MPHRLLGAAAGVTAAYLLTAKLGFQFAFAAEQVTTVWAPTGIAIAALVLWGRVLWPSIWIAALLANLTTGAPLWVSAAIATGNTLEAVIAASLLGPRPRFDATFRATRDVLLFLFVAAGSPLASATIGAGALCAAGIQPWDRYSTLWNNWWLGDVLGAIVVGPVLLTLARGPRRWTSAERFELAALAGATAALTHLVFSQPVGSVFSSHPLEFTIFPLVIAAAVRLPPTATPLVVLTASSVTIWHTVRGAGPFAGGAVQEALILLQTFMGVLAGTGLLLAAAMAERRVSERRRIAGAAVTEVLGSADTLASAAPRVVRAIGETLEWQFAGLWGLDAERDRLICLATWAESPTPLASFTGVSKTIEFARGIGLPGRVWATGQPVWVQDVVLDPNFPRAQAAAAVGLHGAFAFPILLGADFVGVVECFNRTALRPDPDLLTTMATVGGHIGQFVGRKRVEAEIAHERAREQAARRDAEAANRAKDEFLATLSHELRTPLNAIVGWTRVLLDSPPDETTTRNALEVIDRNARLQARLIDDILDVSRIIVGGLVLNIRPVDFASLTSAALDAVRPAATARNIRIEVDVAPDLEGCAGDVDRLQQIVWNLLANAVKFTEPGGRVGLEVFREGDQIAIRVRDTGIGIDPAALPRVFERFWQADASLSRRHGGVGLGLAIVRHLAELHGGSVEAASEGAGTGATFTVRLPLSAQETTRPRTAVR